MTPQTVKDLAELGMTPEALAEKTRQVEDSLHADSRARATSTHQAAPHDKPGEPSIQAINSILGRTRQPRSDKGTTRPPKPKPAAVEAPAQAGALTVEQAQELKDMIQERDYVRANYQSLLNKLTLSQIDVGAADSRVNAFIASLTASK